jgi:hypothetical protein
MNIELRILIAVACLGCLAASAPAAAQTYLGNLSANRFDPDSVANPYGAGSPFARNGVNNPYSTYGSPFSDSISNPFGRYGSEFSADSIHNPFGAGNPYAPDSPQNPFGEGWRIIGQ